MNFYPYASINMVQAMVYVDARTSRILDMVVAKYGLKSKSEAIELVSRCYGVDVLGLELRSEFNWKASVVVRERGANGCFNDVVSS